MLIFASTLVFLSISAEIHGVFREGVNVGVGEILDRVFEHIPVEV